MITRYQDMTYDSVKMLESLLYQEISCNHSELIIQRIWQNAWCVDETFIMVNILTSSSFIYWITSLFCYGMRYPIMWQVCYSQSDAVIIATLLCINLHCYCWDVLILKEFCIQADYWLTWLAWIYPSILWQGACSCKGFTLTIGLVVWGP